MIKMSPQKPLQPIIAQNLEQNQLKQNQLEQNENEQNSVKIKCIERRNAYKDGCSVIIFIILIILSVLFVTFCISKYYTQEKRIKNMKMLNCCRRRMLINSMLSNLSEELANDMRIMFQIESDLHHNMPPVIIPNGDHQAHFFFMGENQMPPINATNVNDEIEITIINNTNLEKTTIRPLDAPSDKFLPFLPFNSKNFPNELSLEPPNIFDHIDRILKTFFPANINVEVKNDLVKNVDQIEQKISTKNDDTKGIIKNNVILNADETKIGAKNLKTDEPKISKDENKNSKKENFEILKNDMDLDLKIKNGEPKSNIYSNPPEVIKILK